MNKQNRDFPIDGKFPTPPVPGSKILTPITSWEEMYHETLVTGFKFDEFWDESIHEGVAYFFRWLGNPRATVLVIWESDRLTHVEGLKAGGTLLSEAEMVQVNAELARAFAHTSFERGNQ
jgi:hypothetical protein